jgi:predicted transposase/invertase (TIGR01784 family)
MTSRPHDALVKAVFGQPQHAGGLMRTILPLSVSAVLRWDTLKREPGSFIDPQLADRHTDLLFSVGLDRADRRGYLYLLLEHQSTVDHDTILRINGYILRICEQLRRDGVTGRLPLIIPMVVTHARNVWTAPRSYDAMFEPSPTSVPDLRATSS